MHESSKTALATQADVQMQWGLKIPLRDSVHLHATLYLPTKQTTPVPAIFVLTPYIGQMYHDQAMYFASHGYPFLTVDVRGRGNSEGDFHPTHEAKDSHDVIEWLAGQNYCNGQVAMWGGSYSGYVQWAAVKELSPHLSTIVPVASPYRGVDSPMRNNMFACYLMRWLTLIWGHTLQDKIFYEQHLFWNAEFRRWFEAGAPFKELDTFVGNPSTLFQEWLSHPQQDAYWDGYNPTAEDYSKLSIPILTITGMYDTNQPGALTHYREYMKIASVDGRARHYLVIGPWDHSGTRRPNSEFGGLKFGPASLVDLSRLHLEWYAWAMQDGPKPQFLQKNVAYYVTGAEVWRYADTLDAITAQSNPLCLHSNDNPTDVFKAGSLTTELSKKREPDYYVYDPHDIGGAELESRLDPDSLTDQRMLLASTGKQLIYHSAPFEKQVEISGFFRLSAWISIDQPDTDFRVWIYEIGLDGSSVLLSTDSMRARYRESFRNARLVHTCEPLHYQFERFTFVSRQVGKGSRLRLVIGPINSIHSQKNYNSGGVVAEESMRDARLVTVKLFHNESYPSALYVPLGRE